MLLLLFKINDQRYAMEAKRIVEILPYLELKELSNGPEYLTGVVNWRGTPVPVIDLCNLNQNGACKQLVSTRVILIDFPYRGIQSRTVGLLAEHVSETVKTPADWQAPRVQDPHANIYIESTVVNKDELIKWFVPEVILPQELTDFLFREF